MDGFEIKSRYYTSGLSINMINHAKTMRYNGTITWFIHIHGNAYRCQLYQFRVGEIVNLSISMESVSVDRDGLPSIYVGSARNVEEDTESIIIDMHKQISNSFKAVGQIRCLRCMKRKS
jgi:hypothetical protein